VHDGDADGPAQDIPDRSPTDQRAPAGDVYTWYRRGVDLLEAGDAAAAAQVLRHAVAAEPVAPSLREALARAEFDAGWYTAARESFTRLVEVEPGNDYALFGLGLAESRLGEFVVAAEHLALAVAMRPDLPHYAAALRRARATVRARAAAEDDAASTPADSGDPRT
jgi:tetratricopeptide (TPR) repeat protein